LKTRFETSAGGFRFALSTLQWCICAITAHRGVQRGFAPLRPFSIPQDWGIKGVEEDKALAGTAFGNLTGMGTSA
jgi:hypothetical protein